MKKKSIMAMLTTMMVISSTVTGCSGAKKEKTNSNNKNTMDQVFAEKDTPTPDATKDSTSDVQILTPKPSEDTKQSTDANQSAETFDFSKISNLEFSYSSGVGSWATLLYVKEDGSFSGNYHDVDADVTYCSDFTGKFTPATKVNDYTYVMEIESIELSKTPNTEEDVDGVHYIYTDAAGLAEAKKLYIYLPGASLSKLPTEYLDWLNSTALYSRDDVKTLPFYGIYNEEEQTGFSSYENVDTAGSSGSDSSNASSSDLTGIDLELANLEEKERVLYKKIDNDMVTQLEMNETTYEVYKLWDDKLNEMWGRIKEKLDKDAMSQLTKEEREWIKKKDNAVKEAGQEYEGGSAQAMNENSVAAEMTKERVYELAKYLK